MHVCPTVSGKLIRFTRSYGTTRMNRERVHGEVEWILCWIFLASLVVFAGF